MLRQKWGSVVCPSCGNLVGINDERCFNCGRWNPGLWGFAPALSRLGRDLGFTQFVIGSCVTLYVLMLLADMSGINTGGLLSFLSPSGRSLFWFGESGAVPVFGYGRWWTVLTAGWLHARKSTKIRASPLPLNQVASTRKGKIRTAAAARRTFSRRWHQVASSG